MNDVKLADLTFPPIEYGVTEQAIAELRQRYADPDASTDEGFEHCKEGVRELTSLRTSIESRRKDLKAPALDWGRKVDKIAKTLTRQIKQIEDPVRQEKERVEEIQQAEARKAAEAEAQRVQTIRDNIDSIKSMAAEQFPGDTAKDYADRIETLNGMTIDAKTFAEFSEEAVTARDAALFKLTQWHEMAEQREADDARRAAEDAELKRRQDEIREREQRIADEERQKREAKEAEEQAAREAEAKRQQAIDNRIGQLRIAGNHAETSAAIRDSITVLKAIELTDDDYAERIDQAREIKRDQLAALNTRLVRVTAQEDEAKRDAEAKMPDKKKLQLWLGQIEAIKAPTVINSQAQKIVTRHGSDLTKLAESLRKAIDKL